MKRDMDLIRTILIQMEERGPNLAGVKLDAPDVDEETLNEHLLLLHEARLVQLLGDQPMDFGCVPLRLTWAGHEFLATAKNDALWRKGLALLGTAATGVSFELLKAWLKQKGLDAIGLGETHKIA